jgi:hypothetical protein
MRALKFVHCGPKAKKLSDPEQNSYTLFPRKKSSDQRAALANLADLSYIDAIT